jgi:ribosome-binding protein aMBF1 (putative translation factor)
MYIEDHDTGDADLGAITCGCRPWCGWPVCQGCGEDHASSPGGRCRDCRVRGHALPDRRARRHRRAPVGRPVLVPRAQAADEGSLMTFPATLTAFRVRRGWSCLDLARRIGAGENTVRGWESGRNRPRPAALARLIALGFVPPPRQQPCVMRRAA